MGTNHHSKELCRELTGRSRGAVCVRTSTYPLKFGSRNVAVLLMLLSAVFSNSCAALTAQEMLFDNLGILDPWMPKDGGWGDARASDRRFAQQFLMNGQTRIDQVTLELIRTGPTARGSVGIELWNDTGDNDPDTKIADLGDIPDVSEMPNSRKNYTFDMPVTELQPEGKYWVVLNFSGMTNISGRNSVGWANVLNSDPLPPGRDASDGTNGAACGHVIALNEGTRWSDSCQHFGNTNAFWVMSVRSGVVEPIQGDFDMDGALTVADINLLTAQIAGDSPDDLAFDLSNDGVVDIMDRDKWLSDAATNNKFGEPYLVGDSNLDGTVDATDLNTLALNWRQDVAEWSGGDYTANGVVDSGDLNALALNWRKSIPMASAVSASVPEPSTWLLAVIGIALVWKRRRRN